ncbi:isochorismate synthase MenF [Affinibrenneria salicis]|uniref:Isochorismate synthase MenF n=1 Tax=Affinibrenneria salicis TaxID=2590031 RepID=A0A5J5G072_9GAMM|nr:isochorismate synthase MenF [Affinibrenneria salicis]KAA9000008.1 isochorismate synthase MenF [Affinibrenneria salicis]
MTLEQLSELLRRMQQALPENLPGRAGFRRISLTLSLTDSASLLPWLAAQPVWPQFYWQHRDESEEAAVCGRLLGFSHMADARTFLQHKAVADSVRIWGLNAFNAEKDGGTSFLFLPRIELLRRGARLEVSVNLFSERSLREDAREACAFIAALRSPRALPPLDAVIAAQQHLPGRLDWIALVRRALRMIDAGDMEKVVLARATRLQLVAPLAAATLMGASRAVNHRCFHFMLIQREHQAFLGSSPERLYRRSDNQLETEALAGTVVSDNDAQRAQALADWLLQDEKNQCENMLVVDDICQRLRQSALTLDVMPAEVIRLRKVQHLRRAIQAGLRTASDSDCLLALQPTAAVAGLPRRAAMRFIREHEPFARGWYAGSAGYLSRRQSEFCVALRSARLNEQTLELYAGAGIVAGSDPEQEWQELENKAAALKSLLAADMS